MHTFAGNRRAAHEDALKLLESLQLPAGATRSSREPAGDGGALKPGNGFMVITPFQVITHTWWRVPTDPDTVMAYVENHPPVGSKLYLSGQGTNGNSYSEFAGFQWPPVTSVLVWRQLLVVVTALPDGDTGLLAQAESVWFVPRPSWSFIPADVREVDIASRNETQGTRDYGKTTSLKVRNASKIRRILALVNAMPLPQGTDGCGNAAEPADAPTYSLTVRFLPRAGAHPLGVASDQVISGSEFCNQIELAIPGHRPPVWLEGEFAKPLQHIIKARLT